MNMKLKLVQAGVVALCALQVGCGKQEAAPAAATVDAPAKAASTEPAVAAPAAPPAQTQAAHEADMKDNAQWMSYQDDKGEKIEVRFRVDQQDQFFADVKLGGKTMQMSKVAEEPNGDPVYGDGAAHTLISRGGGGSVEVYDGKTKRVFR